MKIKPQDTEFTLVQDSREQHPLTFKRDSIVAGLKTGDYSIEGYETEICFERKSIPDLIGTCDFKNRDRFKRELDRMREFQFYAIVIAGTEDDVLRACKKLYKTQYPTYMAKKRRGTRCRPPMRPESRSMGVIGSLLSWRATYNAHFYFLESEEGVAEWIESACEYFMRHKLEAE